MEPAFASPGGTAEKVVKRAHISVLVARPGGENGQIVLATDLSSPSEPAALQFMAPYAGCAIGEFQGDYFFARDPDGRYVGFHATEEQGHGHGHDH